MGSLGDPPALRGTLTVGIDVEVQTDPATRAYTEPPLPTKTVRVSFPLISFRDEVFGSSDEAENTASARQLLREKGFTAIRHRTTLADHPDGSAAFQDVTNIDQVYYPEMKNVLQKFTGCKNVVLQHSAVRGLKEPSIDAKSSTSDGRVLDGQSHSAPHLDLTRPFHRPTGAPIRFPHNDLTPLGARQTVRHFSHYIRDIARDAGVIAAEDQLCETNGLKADSKASEAVQDSYNEPILGPRYAFYSVWRPLKTVTRDPLAMIPIGDVEKSPDLVRWMYDNRMPGPDGDWLRQFEMMKIRKEAVPSDLGDGTLVATSPAWYFVPDLQPDEVLIVKLFDSAALGTKGEAIGSMHGSPDLGEAGYGGPRENVELRAICVW